MSIAGTTVNLSLLARGVGAVKKNGHERVDVLLEPQDYLNYVGETGGVSLPPLRPQYAFSEVSSRPSRDTHEIHLPKTYTTRKGALLLFSEDLAERWRLSHLHNPSLPDVSQLNNIKTLNDFASSILSYGNKNAREVYLKFGINRQHERLMRPGYSARRYLSRLTRSLDDNFLEKLTSKGYIHEKTLFQHNEVLPHIKRRINDDISSAPQPYKILKSMLHGPGFMSGYLFIVDNFNDDLSAVMEEEEESSRTSNQHYSQPDQVRQRDRGANKVRLMRPEDKQIQVSYSSMTLDDKENVLTDLLVKSAINHALEKQKQKILQGSQGGHSLVKSRSQGESRSQSSATPEFNMADAVQSFLESQLDLGSVPQSSTSTSSTFRGSKVHLRSNEGSRSNSARSFDTYEREYIASATVVTLRDSNESSSDSRCSSITSAKGLQFSEEKKEKQPRSHLFNKQPVLPAIQGSRETTMMTEVPSLWEKTMMTEAAAAQRQEFSLNVIPPTPQATTLSKRDIKTEQEIKEIDEHEDEEKWADAVQVGVNHSSVSEYGQQKRTRSAGGQRSSPANILTMNITDEHMTGINGSITSREASNKSKSPVAGHRVNSATSSVKSKTEASVSHSSSASQVSLEIDVTNSVQNKSATKSLKSTMKSPLQSPRLQVARKSMTVRDSPDTDNEESVESTSDESSDERHGTISTDTQREKVDLSQSMSTWVYETPKTQDTSMKKAASLNSLASQDSEIKSKAISEKELVETLTEHAHKIASLVLSRPDTGLDLAHDAKVEAGSLLKARTKSAEPTVAEYQELLKETLMSVVTKLGGDVLETCETEIAPELLDALTHNQPLNPEDLEVFQDETGKNVIRTKTPSLMGDTEAVLAKSPISSVADVNQPDMLTEILTPTQTSRESQQEQEEDHQKAENTVNEHKATEDELVNTQASDDTVTTEPVAPPEPETTSTDTATSTDLATSTDGATQPARKQFGNEKVINKVENAKYTAPEEKKTVLSALDITNLGETKKQDMPKPVQKENSGSKSGTSQRSKKSKNSSRKEEFIVGKVEDKKELQNLYGPSDTEKQREQSKPKEAKPRLPPRKSTKAKTVSKKVKKTDKPKKEKAKSKPKSVSSEDKDEQENKDSVSVEKLQAKSRSTSTKSSQDGSKMEPRQENEEEGQEQQEEEQEEEEEMEFIIIRDVTPTSEWDDKSERVQSAAASLPSMQESSTLADSLADTYKDDTDEESLVQQGISNKDARAAKRAAMAERRRQEVERKRKEREEQLKREKEEAEMKGKIAQELEEERMRREEEKRLKLLRAEEERQRLQREEDEKERRARLEEEREKRQREEYQRRLEEMRRHQAEEDKRRREQEEIERRLAEERRKEEEEMLAKMEEQERLEYERKKRQEEEDRLRREEEQRMRREEEARRQMEEAMRLAAEMARQQAELERRLHFNRGLRLETHGLHHTHSISRAFVFSYFELLRYLGLEVPDFEKLKHDQLY